ncbi:hypothetical protein [Peribacillus alkalitolerans]|uniref:hypothetical protein n=1 Tax=Peribacillus alkalitolerans TaxID=1550385 RepID=UPI0013D59630|nr:hypothetical protein [Peribacillus alkalitolerans]
MFDPTAFDNMKTVLEGAVYDQDLEGAILVTNRNDLLDLAQLSRCFKIDLQLRPIKQGTESTITASLVLRSSLENFAAELLSSENPSIWKNAGANLKIQFAIPMQLPSLDSIQKLTSLLKKQWGENREIIIKEEKTFENAVYRDSLIYSTVQFARLVTEDQLEDLFELVNHVIKSLEELESFTS